MEIMANSKGKFMPAEEVLEALLQNDHTNFNSDSSSNDIHESDRCISINYYYK